MKRTRALLISGLLVTTGWLPSVSMAAEMTKPASPAPIPSAKLQVLHDDFLAKGENKAFWQAVENLSASGGYPIVEDIENPEKAPAGYVRVTFLHRQLLEDPANVFLLANINHVVPLELLFEKIERSNVFFKTVEVPSGVRFMYRIIENDPLTGLFGAAKYGSRVQVLGDDPDPLNPNKYTVPNAFGEGRHFTVSWAELPGAAPQPYVVDQGNESGQLIPEERDSDLLGYSRQIVTYLPPGYDPARAYPLMILLDGRSYFYTGSLQLTLDNLIADGSIPPLIVLGIDAGVREGRNQRNVEFTCNPAFMSYLNEELLPWFTSKYAVSSDPDERIIAGSSFGGLFAAYFAFNNPGTVANVLSQSGSFHWGKKDERFAYEWLIREFAFGDRRAIRIYMEVGVLEGEYSWSEPEYPHAIASHRHFKTILDMKGYDTTYHEYGGGHEMLSWRGGIADGLKQIFRTSGRNSTSQ